MVVVNDNYLVVVVCVSSSSTVRLAGARPLDHHPL